MKCSKCSGIAGTDHKPLNITGSDGFTCTINCACGHKITTKIVPKDGEALVCPVCKRKLELRT
ncbi:MAG: hypothetical protein ABSF55_02970 [Candidatus Staskawiczbacteria bacterium]